MKRMTRKEKRLKRIEEDKFEFVFESVIVGEFTYAIAGITISFFILIGFIFLAAAKLEIWQEPRLKLIKIGLRTGAFILGAILMHGALAIMELVKLHYNL